MVCYIIHYAYSVLSSVLRLWVQVFCLTASIKEVTEKPHMVGPAVSGPTCGLKQASKWGPTYLTSTEYSVLHPPYLYVLRTPYILLGNGEALARGCRRPCSFAGGFAHDCWSPPTSRFQNVST